MSEGDRMTGAPTAAAANTLLWKPTKRFDDFALVCCGEPHLDLLSDPDDFSLTQRVGRVGMVTVSEIVLGTDMSMDAGEVCGAYRIVVPLSGRIEGLYRRWSLDTGPGVASVYAPEGHAAARWAAGSRLISLKIDRSAVDDALRDALGRQVTSQPDFTPVMSTDAAPARSWISMVVLFKEQLFLPGTVLSHPLVGPPFADSLVRGFLLAADHPYRNALFEEERLGAPRAVRTAVEIIEGEADLPLTLSSIAARCHVSVRSLQQGFRQHLGTSPMAYLREVRLRRAHQTLLRSDASAVTVASVAYQWGFSNLGRFAAAHAARYGETPTETLRRPASSPAASVLTLRQSGASSGSLTIREMEADHRRGAVSCYEHPVSPDTNATAHQDASIDPQLARTLRPLLSARAAMPRPPAGDWQTRRTIIEHALDRASALLSPVNGIKVDGFTATATDGTQLPLFLYRRADTGPSGSAALFLHGGGMIMGWHRSYDMLVRNYVASSGVPLLSVHYRVAPEHPYPTPVEDCYTALRWLATHATDLGIDPARIAVMGGSAGGGLAASVTLLARDRGGPPLARQLLLAPMLDDRTATVDARTQSFCTWDCDDNITGWRAFLGDMAGSDDVSPYAAPGRADDLSGLPPAYIDVGALDIFCDEDLTYAKRLMAAGIPTEFHLYAGAPHGFEIFAPQTDVARRAADDRMRCLARL